MININEFEKVVENLQEHIFHTNKQFEENLKSKKDNNIIATKENLSMVISFGLIEDLRTIILLNSMTLKERYINYIIRGMVEQVIEYKYLIMNSDLIKEYFGSKIRFKDQTKAELDKCNLVKELRKLSGDRYANGREKIYNMAKDIKEDQDINKKLSLYSIFCICSEEMHNSYFEAFLDRIENIENKEDKVSLTEFQLTLIYIIIERFTDTYDII